MPCILQWRSFTALVTKEKCHHTRTVSVNDFYVLAILFWDLADLSRCLLEGDSTRHAQVDMMYICTTAFLHIGISNAKRKPVQIRVGQNSVHTLLCTQIAINMSVR